MMLCASTLTKTSGVPISVCGRVCHIFEVESVANLQKELQNSVGMPEQDFDLTDTAGRRLVTDQQLQEAIQSMRVPLQANLSDASVHFIENRREELAQMQWKVLRDKLHGCGADVLALSNHVSELQQQHQVEAKEAEKKMEALRNDIGSQLNQDRITVEAGMHQFTEQLQSFTNLLKAEQNKREYTQRALENQIQDLRDALDREGAERSQELNRQSAMLREGSTSVDSLRHAFESWEQKHMLEFQALKADLAQTSRKITNSASEQLDVFRVSMEELSRKIKHNEGEMSRKMAELCTRSENMLAKLNETEAHGQELDMRLSQTNMNNSERLQRVTERQDQFLEAIETVQVEKQSLDMKLSTTTAEVKELEAMVIKLEEETRKFAEKESAIIREEIQSAQLKLSSQQTKRVAEIEAQWSERFERESGLREAQVKSMFTEIRKVASPRRAGAESPASPQPTLQALPTKRDMIPAGAASPGVPALKLVPGYASPPAGSMVLPQSNRGNGMVRPSPSTPGLAWPVPGGIYSPRTPMPQRVVMTQQRSPSLQASVRSSSVEPGSLKL